MRTLLIDDFRSYKADRICRDFDDGLKALTEEGPWDLLLLDFDLGDVHLERTGLGLAREIVKRQKIRPRKIQILTSNPAGRLAIEGELRKVYQKEENGEWSLKFGKKS